MPKTQSRAVMNWIAVFGSLAIFLVVYGGFVRLTRSGLSIVEWNPVMGAIPPLNQPAWQTEFAKYQLTPEYREINFKFTTDYAHWQNAGDFEKDPSWDTEVHRLEIETINNLCRF